MAWGRFAEHSGHKLVKNCDLYKQISKREREFYYVILNVEIYRPIIKISSHMKKKVDVHCNFF